MSAAGVRSTRQRAAISTLLETLDDFRSAQELHDELRRRGENIGLTTVYRTLQSMASSGLVDTLHTDTGLPQMLGAPSPPSGVPQLRFHHRSR